MKWLVLWTAIGLLQLAVLAGCGWVLWRKGRALYEELRTQGHTLGGMTALLGELEWPAERAAASQRSDRSRCDRT